MAKRNVVISVNNNEDAIVLPVVPDFDIVLPISNERISMFDRPPVNLVGTKELWEFEISSFFPRMEYGWTKKGSHKNPRHYIGFFEKWINRDVPFRVVASDPLGDVWFNLAVTLDDFQYKWHHNGSCYYKLKFTQYRFLGVDIVD